MDNTTWNEVNSTLDLNGPILSYSEQPTGSTGVGTAIDGTISSSGQIANQISGSFRTGFEFDGKIKIGDRFEG